MCEDTYAGLTIQQIFQIKCPCNSLNSYNHNFILENF